MKTLVKEIRDGLKDILNDDFEMTREDVMSVLMSIDTLLYQLNDVTSNIEGATCYHYGVDNIRKRIEDAYKATFYDEDQTAR